MPMTRETRPRLSLAEVFGLRPVGVRLAQARMAVRGDAVVPKTRWGLSSLRILKPRMALPIWLGMRRPDRRVPIYTLFNRTPTPVEEGWSVRVTQVRDFRGGRLSYDSHNGTDFAVPVGTLVAASANGRVVRVSNEFHRGGLKIFIDHGGAIVTSYNHLGRALVEQGDRVVRGQVIALSGASGIDNVLFFPWTAPHVHYNVFLDGLHVDPYAVRGETSLWLGGEPLPAGSDTGPELAPAAHDEPNLLRMVETCRSADLARRLRAMEDMEELGAELLFQTTYFPTRFAERLPLYRERHPRREILSLPFLGEDFVGAHLPD